MKERLKANFLLASLIQMTEENTKDISVRHREVYLLMDPKSVVSDEMSESDLLWVRYNIFDDAISSLNTLKFFKPSMEYINPVKGWRFMYKESVSEGVEFEAVMADAIIRSIDEQTYNELEEKYIKWTS